MNPTAQLRSFVVAIVARMRRPAALGAVAEATGTSCTVQSEDEDELLRGRLLQQYGFASRPPAGSPAVVVFRGGSSAGSLVVATGAASYTVALADGEVALYHPSGAQVLLDRDGNVTLQAAPGAEVRLGSGATEAVVCGDSLLGWLNETLIPWLNAHTNPEGGPPPTPLELASADLLSQVAKVE